MSQEVQVLQCYSCQSYQTQIVKKTNKWVCKLCNEKQVVKKVLGQGNGKDCRKHCQRLNALREAKQKKENNLSLSLYGHENTSECSEERSDKNMSSQPGNSKWNKYLSQTYTSEVDEEEQDDIYPSQLYFPSSTPVSVDIPSPANSRNDSVQTISNLSSDFFMDSDDCLFVDIPQDSDTSRKDTHSSERNEIRTNTINTAPKKQQNELLPSDSVGHGVSIQSTERSIKNSEHLKMSKAKPIEVGSGGKGPSGPNHCETNAVFKMVPSDGFDIEHFKKSISLFEDIDKYTTDELTEMCKF
ncbi:hypothetical protein R5R35_001274 [Gryllus longicercus]|uniref:MRN complex-interacting protein N-terminal domain-containing protein n=1 Tax=Gryllus longicercus TaxID=2509291 RepID=A0AAN9Z2P2_9ORTH